MMENRKTHNETKLPRLLNPINTVLTYQYITHFIRARFVRINKSEYNADFDFFIRNPVHVIQYLDNTTIFCSQLEKRCFRKDKTHLLDDAAFMIRIREVHNNIISLEYGGELVFLTPKPIKMLLQELPKEFRTNHIYSYKYGLVEHQCKATDFPFRINNRVNMKLRNG